MVLNEHSLDTNQVWFSDPLIDYKKNVIGAKSDLYGNYIYLNDGVIAGFRFYDSCDATEINAVAPKNRIHYEIKNICASILIDVNAFKRPNKLGSDQFIIPIDIYGIKFTNEEL